MKNIVLKNWSFPRILHLIIGVVIMFEAVYRKDMISGLGGLIFTGMGIFNISFCGSRWCYLPVKHTKDAPEDVVYKEVL